MVLDESRWATVWIISDTRFPSDIGASRAAPSGTGRATDFHVRAGSASPEAIFQKKPEIHDKASAHPARGSLVNSASQNCP